VQGRSTAAIGSAIGVSLFALVLSFYAQDWQEERHMRGYLVDEVHERIGDNDPIIGPGAMAVVRVIPFGVFSTDAMERMENSFDELDDISGVSADDPHEGKIDVISWGGPYAAGVATTAPVPSTGVTDPAAEPGATATNPTAPTDAGAAATDPAVDPAAAPTATGPDGTAFDPATGLPVDPNTGEPIKQPAKPTEQAYDCASYGGWSCFHGYKKAWKQRYVPEAPLLHEHGGTWYALLSIPFWILIASVLLTRRRDLAS
jgi:hypothetical protein